MASEGVAKRQKIVKINDLIDELKQKGIFSKLKTSAKAMCIEKRNALAVLQINNCNAAEGFGISFSRAWCRTHRYFGELYPFGTIFFGGLKLLNGIFQTEIYSPSAEEIPEENLVEMLKKLLLFICDEDSTTFLLNLHKKKMPELNSDACLTAVAEHLFTKLALDSNYLLDNSRKSSATDNCPCGCNAPIKAKFGNTSIGHSSVWHGSIDMLVGKNSTVPVFFLEESSNPGENIPEEDDIESEQAKHQMLAQGIVFSFLQKKHHPEFKHFLFPCVGSTTKQIIFYFYDSKNDILLQSSAMPFILEDINSINLDLIVTLWLVLNYKFLGSGPSEDMLKAPKSGFFSIADSVIDIYNDYLSMGEDIQCNIPQPFEPTRYDVKFTWPENKLDLIRNMCTY